MSAAHSGLLVKALKKVLKMCHQGKKEFEGEIKACPWLV